MTKYRIKEIEYESGRKEYEVYSKGIKFKKIISGMEIFILPPFIIIPFVYWMYLNLFYTYLRGNFYKVDSAQYFIDVCLGKEVKETNYIKIN